MGGLQRPPVLSPRAEPHLASYKDQYRNVSNRAERGQGEFWRPGRGGERTSGWQGGPDCLALVCGGAASPPRRAVRVGISELRSSRFNTQGLRHTQGFTSRHWSAAGSVTVMTHPSLNWETWLCHIRKWCLE